MLVDNNSEEYNRERKAQKNIYLVRIFIFSSWKAGPKNEFGPVIAYSHLNEKNSEHFLVSSVFIFFNIAFFMYYEILLEMMYYANYWRKPLYLSAMNLGAFPTQNELNLFLPFS